jgi:cytochrome c-type biogenesis protein CcmF
VTGLIGQSAVLLALAAALYAAAALPLGARLRRPRLAESGARAIVVHFGLVMLAFLAIEYALVTSDFSLKYVAQNCSWTGWPA